MTDLAPTPGQTVGPFFHYALPYPGDRELVRRGTPGSVWLHGYVYDGDGNGMPDALLEIRQADPRGVVPEIEGSMRRDGARFTGWGRTNTDPTGHYWFSTVEPGPTVVGAAPFFAVTFFARGLLNRLFTRIYLPGFTDPLLDGLSADERSTLVAVREGDGSLRFDVHVQGPRETVFLRYS
jgi:protocatechuate 3,4-dioxygenase alpha subunit